MKIKPCHIKKIHTAMAETVTRSGFQNMNEVRQMYAAKKIGKDTQKRANWDVAKASRIEGLSFVNWICKEIYPYANDGHIDTVLARMK